MSGTVKKIRLTKNIKGMEADGMVAGAIFEVVSIHLGRALVKLPSGEEIGVYPFEYEKIEEE